MAIKYDYSNLLARQINGEIAKSFLTACHNAFLLLKDFFEHRRTLSLDTATSTELDAIGLFLGMPRPYCSTMAHAATFDVTYTARGNRANVAENTIHERIEGIVWELKDYLYRASTMLLYPPNSEEITKYADDDTYRLYIQNMAGLRRSHSLLSLADMLYLFNDAGTFELEFQENGDILIFLDEQYNDYEPFLQIALDLVYNAEPQLGPIKLIDYYNAIANSAVRTQLIEIADPDWLFWVDGTQSSGGQDLVGYISCDKEHKCYVLTEDMIPNTDKSWIIGDDESPGTGLYKHTLFMITGNGDE